MLAQEMPEVSPLLFPFAWWFMSYVQTPYLQEMIDMPQ